MFTMPVLFLTVQPWLTEGEAGLLWASIKARKGHSHISLELRLAFHEWLLAHDHVKPSPITNDTLLILNSDTGKKSRLFAIAAALPDLPCGRALPVLVRLYGSAGTSASADDCSI